MTSVTDISTERARRRALEGQTGGVDGGGDGTHDSGMDSRLAKLEGQVDGVKGHIDGLKHAVDAFRWVIGLGAAAIFAAGAWQATQMIALNGRVDSGFSRVDAAVASVGAKIDRIPEQMAAEFRAIRAESTAQTSAIADAITAAKQQPTQVLILPASATQTAPPAPGFAPAPGIEPFKGNPFKQ